ncbi:Armadillo-type fold [Pseudocohnilembus persalinus]|uniref:Armadillo-type fold n=1 Tax=Pseudocohnilembus persalinus TaxID=266149 RepID=A0A0V0QP95_PSEPJ|nr:Armadillo-type fold [Pseudocohnilembus persalinus]|eukprot:KRX04110.1 Armadillo-type fold [Pseudocohnilembus persalinus]
MTIQIDVLNRKMNMWDPKLNNQIKLEQAITRFFHIINQQNFETEIQKKKIEEFCNQKVEPIRNLEFFSSINQDFDDFEDIQEAALRCQKLIFSFYEMAKKQGKEVPSFFEFKKIKDLEKSLPDWDAHIQNQLKLLQQSQQKNPKTASKVYELLIFQINQSKKLKEIALECGAMKISINQLEIKNNSEEITKQALNLIRDLCQNQQKACDLLYRHSPEQNLISVFSQFKNSSEVENYLSDILQKMLKAQDFDQSQFDDKFKEAQENLKIYTQTDNLTQENIEKAIQNTELLKFYSLAPLLCQKLVNSDFIQTLLAIVKKQMQLDTSKFSEEQKQHHEEILSNTIRILNKMIEQTENIFIDDENPVFPISSGLQPQLHLMLKYKIEANEVINSALDSFIILFNNYRVKNQTMKKCQERNFTEDLYKLAQHYQETLKKQHYTSFIKEIVLKFQKQDPNKPQKKETLEEKQLKLQNLSYLADLSKNSDNFITDQDLEYLLKKLKEVNAEIKAENPHKGKLYQEENLEDFIYDLQYLFSDLAKQEHPNIDFLDEDEKKEQQIQLNNQQNIIDILRKITTNENQVNKFASENLIKEVLRYLRMKQENRDIVISALRFLNNILSLENNQQFIDLIAKNKGVESVFIALNQHPTDKDVLELSGQILQILDAFELSKDVKEQYPALQEEFDPTDQESMEALRQANIYLGNLFTAEPDEEMEENQDFIRQNYEVVKTLEKCFDHSLPIDSLAANLLIVGRLANQGEETKMLIKNSLIPQKIMQQVILKHEFMDPTKSGRISELALDALLGLISGDPDQAPVPMLDSETGEEILYETEEMKLEYLKPLDQVLSLNEYAPFNAIIKLIDSKNLQFQNTVKKAAQLLASCIHLKKEFLSQFTKSQSQAEVLNVFLQLLKKEQNQKIKEKPFKIVGKLVAILAQKIENFNLVVCQQGEILPDLYESLTQINIQDYQNFINNLNQMDTLQSLLQFTQKLTQNKFDKKLIIEAQIPQAITKVVSKLISIPYQEYQESQYLCIIMEDALQCMNSQIQEKITGMELMKNNQIQTLIQFQQNFHNPTDILQNQQILNELNDADEIIGNPQPLQRMMDSLYTIIEYCTQNLKTTQIASKLYDTKLNFVSYPIFEQNEPFIITKMLQSFYKFLITFDTETLSLFGNQQQQEKFILNFKKFKQDSNNIKQYISNKYPNLPIINKLCNLILEHEPILESDRKKVEDSRAEAYNLKEKKNQFNKLIQQLHNYKKLLIKHNPDINARKSAIPSSYAQEEQTENLKKSQIMARQTFVPKKDTDKNYEEQDISQQKSSNSQISELEEDDEEEEEDEKKQIDNILNLLVSDANPENILQHNNEQTENQKDNQNLDDKNQQQQLTEQQIINGIQGPEILSFLATIQHELEQFQNQISSQSLVLNTEPYQKRQLFIIEIIKSIENYVTELIEVLMHCLAHITNYSQALKNMDKKVEFVEIDINFINYFLNQNKSTIIEPQIFINAMELLDNTCRYEVSSFIKNQGLDLLRNIIKEQDNAKLLCLNAILIDKLAQSEKICLEIVPPELLERILALYNMHQKNLEFLQNFAILIGTICRAISLQQKMGELSFHDQIIKALTNFPEDTVLATNSFYALSGLAYNCKENSNKIGQQTSIFSISLHYLQSYRQECELIETLCSFYSNITYKNEKNKDIISKQIGTIGGIVGTASFYMNQSELKPRTLKQILRALGNLSLYFPNTDSIMKTNFIQQAKKLIEKKLKYKENNDILRYTIDVISNLACHQDNLNNKNTDSLAKQGILLTTTRVMKKNQLEFNILSSCCDLIDGLIQNKFINQSACINSYLEILLRIMVSQEDTSILILKINRILSKFALIKQNFQTLVHAQTVHKISEVLKNQKKVNQKLYEYTFRVINRLCVDTRYITFSTSGILQALGYQIQNRGVQQEIMQNSIELIQNLTNQAQNVPILAKCCTVNLIQRGLEFRNNPKILKIILNLLDLFMLSDPNINKQVIQNGGFEFFVAVLQQNPSSEEIEQSLKALRGLCQFSQQFRKLSEQQQVQQILEGLQTKVKGNSKQYLEQILLFIYNKKTEEQENQTNITYEQALNFFKKGFEGKLYLTERKIRPCIVYIDDDGKCFKAKKIVNSSIKVQIPVKEVSDYNFDFDKTNQVWNFSVFSKVKGLFKKEPIDERCISIFGKLEQDGLANMNIELIEGLNKKYIKQAFLTIINHQKE